MNCAVVKELSILLSAMHKISRFSLTVVLTLLRLWNLYLIEFVFNYEKMILRDSEVEEILRHLVQF